MKLSSLEEFSKKGPFGRTDKRKELIKLFPYTVVLEGNYPEHDFATRWCWQQFGPRDGLCEDHYSEYPACPLVVLTEKKQEYRDHEGNVEVEKVYSAPEKHNHIGTWTMLWLGKTGYDYGFNEWFFKLEENKQAFLLVYPTFTIGENYGQ